MANEGRLRPDFKKMEMEGIAVLNNGLPALSEVLIHSTPVSLACWKTDACGAVMFFFYFQNEEREICSSNITLRYNREDAGWHPDNGRFFFGELRSESPGWIDPIGAPESLEYAAYYALNASGSMYNSEPDPGHAAIVVSGRHSPDVSKICADTRRNHATTRLTATLDFGRSAPTSTYRTGSRPMTGQVEWWGTSTAIWIILSRRCYRIDVGPAATDRPCRSRVRQNPSMAMDDRVHLEDDVSPAAWIARVFTPLARTPDQSSLRGSTRIVGSSIQKARTIPTTRMRPGLNGGRERSDRPLGDAVPHDQSGSRKSRTGTREFHLRTGRRFTSASPEDPPH